VLEVAEHAQTQPVAVGARSSSTDAPSLEAPTRFEEPLYLLAAIIIVVGLGLAAFTLLPVLVPTTSVITKDEAGIHGPLRPRRTSGRPADLHLWAQPKWPSRPECSLNIVILGLAPRISVIGSSRSAIFIYLCQVGTCASVGELVKGPVT